MDRRVALHVIAALLGAPLVEELVRRTEGGDQALALELRLAGDQLWQRATVGATGPIAVDYRALVRHGARLDALAGRAGGSWLRTDLLRLHAQTFGRAAYLAWTDLGRFDEASQHVQAAMRSAKATGDGQLVAALQVARSRQASHHGNPAEALALLDAATAHANSGMPNMLVVHVQTLRATAFALSGRPVEARTSLELAEGALDAGLPPTPYPVLSDYCPTSLACSKAFVLLVVGAHVESAGLLEGILRQPVSHTRRGRLLTDLAEARFRQGEPAVAARSGMQALEIAVRLDSHERRSHLRQLRRHVVRHHDIPEVRELGEQLQAAGLAAA